MNYRNRLTKPSAALWGFVAVAHVVTMTAVAAVQTILTVLGGVATLAVAGAGLWLLRGSTGGVGRPVPVRAARHEVQRSR